MSAIRTENQANPVYMSLGPLCLSLLFDRVKKSRRLILSLHVLPNNEFPPAIGADIILVDDYFYPLARDFDEFKYTVEEDKRLRDIAKKLADE